MPGSSATLEIESKKLNNRKRSAKKKKRKKEEDEEKIEENKERKKEKKNKNNCRSIKCGEEMEKWIKSLALFFLARKRQRGRERG